MKAKVIRDISPVLKIGDILVPKRVNIFDNHMEDFYVKEGEEFRRRTGNTPPNGYPKQQVESMAGWFEISE